MAVVSIIIPVYNTQNYIERCVNSLLIQDFEDFELILIDDGSNDQSADICDDIAEKDARVQSIHIKHAGVSSARNIGLKHATGSYILFVDSDDEVTQTCLTDLLAHEADIIVSGFLRKTVEKQECYIPEREKCYCEEEKTTFLNDYLLRSIFFDGPCSKLLKRSVIEDYQLRFNESLSYAEDKLFINSFLLHAKSYCIIDKPTYINIRRHDSLSSDITSDQHVQQLLTFLPLYVNVVEQFQNKYPCKATKELYHQEVVARYTYRILNIFKEHECRTQTLSNVDFIHRLLVNDSTPPQKSEGKYIVFSYNIAKHLGKYGLYAFMMTYNLFRITGIKHF